MKLSLRRATYCLLSLLVLASLAGAAPEPVATKSGSLLGLASADGAVRAFRGIPFAAPPVGELRWREPRPAPAWQGVRQATAFGPRCMQGPIFGDMVFRDQPSEDCLYLNVWTPAKAATERLPVMFWIHGGGFQAGSASEPRQDGERLARKGVVVVSANHRLGVFGFFAHAGLTAESGRGASGNYGFMDMVAALAWVRDNVAAFGGDPANVTIFGESAGSFAVSALMASPSAQGLFHRAIGESGAFFRAGDAPLAPKSLAGSEEHGAKLAAALGADSPSALRAKTADEVLQAALKLQPWFSPTIDGHVLPKPPPEVYAAGAQSKVPLLAGWNADEVRAGVVLGRQKTTAASFSEQARTRYGAAADALLAVYPAGSDAEAVESAAALAGDTFVGFATWKWLEAHARAGGGVPVYRFSFDRKIPVAPDTKVMGQPATSADIGARHAGEIEYVFGMLDTIPGVTWPESDRKLTELMMSYWSNFARAGDPNAPGLPQWPRLSEKDGFQVMHLDETSRAAPDSLRKRYETLDAILSAPPRAAAAQP